MTEADIEYLRKVIERQSNMESLWTDPFGSLPTIQETILKAALRHLHAIVEKDRDAAFRAQRVYWDLDSEL